MPDLDEIARLTSGPDLVAVRPRVADRVRTWWVPRRVLAFVAFVPLALWLLLDSRAAVQPMPLLLAVSVGAALAWTSYVPLRGETFASIWRSPCAGIGGILPIMCAMSVLTRPGQGVWAIALGFIGFGLFQRFGSGTCGVR
jgi:hypothetical protein